MENNIRELIEWFLKTYCAKVPENEEDGNDELMMDDHHCIEYLDVEYYVPENNSLWSEEDELLKAMIVNTFEL